MSEHVLPRRNIQKLIKQGLLIIVNNDEETVNLETIQTHDTILDYRYTRYIDDQSLVDQIYYMAKHYE